MFKYAICAISSAGIAIALGFSATVCAAFPDRPITIIVPYAAGGLTDSVARTLAEGITKELGVSVVIENRTGAGGKIGMDAIRRAPKDGYTLGIAVPGTMVMLPLIDPNYGMVPLKDFTPITIAVNTFTVLVVSKQALPSGGLEKFIEMAKTRPGKLNYGTPGAGTSFHFNSELLGSKLGIEAVHVPYKGESAALADLAGGQIDFMLAGEGAKAFVDGGRVRAIAVSSKKRIDGYPNTPTFMESGVDFSTDGWVGMIGPSDLPPAVLEKLLAALVATVKSAKAQAAFARMGYSPVGNTPAEFRKQVEESSIRYGDMLTSGKVKLGQ